MMNNIRIIVQFLQMNSMKTRFGDFSELGFEPGASGFLPSVLWMSPDIPSASSGQVFFFPHTLNQSVCSQSLIDLPLNFLRAGMSFILYLAQHKRFLPSLVILNLQLNDKC